MLKKMLSDLTINWSGNEFSNVLIFGLMECIEILSDTSQLIFTSYSTEIAVILIILVVVEFMKKDGSKI